MNYSDDDIESAKKRREEIIKEQAQVIIDLIESTDPK